MAVSADRMTTTPRRWREALDRADPQDLALRLTLLYFVLEPGIHWQERVPVQALAAAALLVPGWLQSRGIWGLLAAVNAFRLLYLWPHADNHDYFATYWCLAIFVTRWAPDVPAALARSARLLLGCGFALALLWKAVLSPDFLNGDFFRLALLMDGRFPDLARLAGGLSLALQEGNARFLAGQGGVFVEPPALVFLAGVMTTWTLAVEALLAVVFLWPDGSRPGPLLSGLRDGLLILFCASTFAVAPVAGFGWLLVAMGVAQCGPGRTRVRGFYLATFLIILVYASVPWLELLADAFQGGQG
ncbi:MAG: hypothetical protein VCB42_10290 [Myxococcota bacterium]